MREWIEELSDFMSDSSERLVSEESHRLLNGLSEEMHQAAVEANVLFAASDTLQSAYISLIGKIDHVNS